MAKQSGIHQIKGKVGEMSYYRQSGVNAGIIRSINPSMSGRVKNDAAYENTRLNNAEFGQACKIASVLGRFFSPKYRPMILPFSQSKMAKDVLEIIKADPTNIARWGYRGLKLNPLEIPVDTLNSTAKNNFSDLVANVANEVDTGGENYEITTSVTFQSGIADKLSAYGATGVYVRACLDTFFYARPSFATHSPAQVLGREAVSHETEAETYSSAVTIVNTIAPAPSVPSGSEIAYAVTVVIMPYREVGGVKHILQEACTFQCQQIDL